MRPCPLDLQLRDVLGIDPWLRLEAGVIKIVAPAVPLWPFQVEWRRSPRASVRSQISFHRRPWLFSGEVNRKGANLFGVQSRRLLLHRSRGQSHDHIFSRAPADEE